MQYTKWIKQMMYIKSIQYIKYMEMMRCIHVLNLKCNIKEWRFLC